MPRDGRVAFNESVVKRVKHSVDALGAVNDLVTAINGTPQDAFTAHVFGTHRVATSLSMQRL